MKASLIDTNILSLFFRGQPQVVAKFEAYLAEHQRVQFSTITYYEIISGLKHRDAHKQIDGFRQFAMQSNIVALTLEAVEVAADFYAGLRQAGKPIEDIDLLIAGTAVAHNLVLVTQNVKHFERIPNLEIADWSH